jgi:hypothetical protein
MKDLFAKTLLAALFTALAACHTPSTRATVPDRAPPPDAHPLDASYDWHGLLIAPFGGVLKDVPVALHDVLLFRDEAHGGAADDAECYAADAAAPRFAGGTPDEYLLCFRQDHLFRVQASVRLRGADASDLFAAACAGWLKNAAPPATAAAPQNTGTCDGRDGNVRFSGHLEEEVLSITLDSASIP